jgi:hypothetical protein
METLELIPKKETEMVQIGKKITTGIAAFENKKADLEQLKLKAVGLKITDINDKTTIVKVSGIRKELKAARVEIEKEGKLMRDQLTTINRGISAKEKELVSIIEPTERELMAQEKWVEDEKEKIRLEDERKEQERIQARVNQLAAYGFTIDINQIQTLSDDDFQSVLDDAKVEFDKEQAAKAEAERLAKEEAEKLQREREELEQLRKEHNEREAKLKEEADKIEAEKRAIEEAKQREIAAKKREEELNKAREEAAEQARLQAIEDQKAEVARKAEAERLAKLEQEREESLRPDKEKLQSLATTIAALQLPTVTDAKAQQITNDVQIMLGKVEAHILRKIKEL